MQYHQHTFYSSPKKVEIKKTIEMLKRDYIQTKEPGKSLKLEKAIKYMTIGYNVIRNE